MDDLVKFEVIKLPKVLIVGKEIRYSDEALNNGDNRLPGFWDRCYQENIFAPLESQTEHIFDNSYAGVFLDWYLGDGDFSYIVGMLMKEGATVPAGYFARELAETEVALIWIKCKSITETRTVPFESTAKAIKEAGRNCANMKWCIDLYHPIRSTTPDENGNVILDCYIPLD
jgi:predicted transcriptional regulator YdeE